MIEVSVTPGEIVAGRPSRLVLRFFNSGRGGCFNVEFKLRLPPGVVLMGGEGRVDIPVLTAGREHTHAISVLAPRAGPFELTSATFTYRDEFDEQRRVNDFSFGMVATDAPPPVQVRQPSGRLRVECEDTSLPRGDWEMLRVLVSNGTGAGLSDVIVAVEGPFDTDGKRSRIAALGDGTTARCSFRVNAGAAGQHVPVTVRTTYAFRDAGGELRTRTQEDSVSVAVREAERHGPPASAEQVVLYLAASPRDMPALRSDLEMRKVQEKLARSRQRERYRIEWCPAARFEDISQALMDFEPHVVHFSGHGDADGNLCVEDETGHRDLVTPDGLADLFGQHRATLRCVVVNACHSMQLAETMAQRIEHTVGMRNQIADEVAIQFSVGFYEGLFAGWPVPKAFDRGCAHIRSRPGTGEQHVIPLLFPREQAPGSVA
ncbi:CHAT domain-containing protein [Dactylosporangium sp. NPDC051541]|uniref:CHAT domain-containing protein n=1 Tax=Dactylosporangium sp. NPDC051541 TaxID=3363977 RepID=UPI0037901E0B